MDVAASEFFIEGKYDLDFKSPPNAARNISAEELASIYQGFINNYPGVYSDVCEYAFVCVGFQPWRTSNTIHHGPLKQGKCIDFHRSLSLRAHAHGATASVAD